MKNTDKEPNGFGKFNTVSRTIGIVFISVLLPLGSKAQNPVSVVSSEISQVTVSLNGATVNRKMVLNLHEGFNSFQIEGLPFLLRGNSFQMVLNDNLRLVSLLEQKDSIVNMAKLTHSRKITDSIEALSLKLKTLLLENEAILIEKKILIENIQRIGGSGVSVAEMQTTIPFYRAQLKSIHEKLIPSDQAIVGLEHKITQLNSSLGQLKADAKKLTQTISFVLESKIASKETILFSYVVESAFWQPVYDVKSKGAGSPINFIYKARVINQTGEDWLKIPLTLTTMEPSFNMQRPGLDIWALSYQYTNLGNEGAVANFQMRNNRTDSEYKQASDITVTDNASEFKLKGFHSIFSREKGDVLEVNSFTFPAAYHYYCVPKKDPKVYLMSRITNWEAMNLVEGTANVYLDNVFVGSTNIDIQTANDTLELFLGLDKSIVVNRVKKKNEGSQNVIGLNKTIHLDYLISVRNNRPSPIDIEIVDQVPISQESDIEVNINKLSGASHDPVSGRLVWNLTVPSTETKTISFDFNIKYPRQKKVNVNARGKTSAPKYR